MGKWRIVTVSASPLYNAECKIRGSVGAFIDITDLKVTEAKLRDILNNLENIVEERTSELEKAYKSVKESEGRLAEAQRIAHVGNWEWDIATDNGYWSDEIYRIFGFDPQEFDADYNLFFKLVHPDDRDYVSNAVKEALNRGTL